MRLANRLRELPVAERRLLGEAAFVLGGVRVLLPLFGYLRTVRLLDRLAPSRPRRSSTSARALLAERVTWAARAVAERLPAALTCLPRSVAARHMLRGRGLDAVLELGVRREADALFAHAWIEVDGRRVGDDTDPERHRPLESASSTAARTRGSSTMSRG